MGALELDPRARLTATAHNGWRNVLSKLRHYKTMQWQLRCHSCASEEKEPSL
jgi:hypothetical protein